MSSAGDVSKWPSQPSGRRDVSARYDTETACRTQDRLDVLISLGRFSSALGTHERAWALSPANLLNHHYREHSGAPGKKVPRPGQRSKVCTPKSSLTGAGVQLGRSLWLIQQKPGRGPSRAGVPAGNHTHPS